MNKELTPLEALNTLRNGLVDERVVCITRKTFDKCLDIVETALKTTEKYENFIFEICNYIGIDEPLKNLDRTNEEIRKYFDENACLRVDKICNKKKLKALEIIKEHLYISSCKLEHFTIDGKTEDEIVLCFGDMYIPVEEFDLVKEELL